MEFHGEKKKKNKWSSMEFINSMEVHGLPWTSVDLRGPPWTSVDLHGISIDFRGPPWSL
jgi:hypothetical protein